MFSSAYDNYLLGNRIGLAILLTAVWVCTGWAQQVFEGERALTLIHRQCELGPRIPGSEGNRELRRQIVTSARDLGLSVREICFEETLIGESEPVQLCNIVVSVGPSGGDRLWLGAHYDTRPICDRDPDPERKTQPLVGANDGASGVAVLWHLMEILAEDPPLQGVDLLYFDGEDSGVSGDPTTYCRGSARLASTWQDMGNPLSAGRPRGLILLDMVGKKGLQVPVERYSSQYAPQWAEYVHGRAYDMGLSAFVPEVGPAVYDDHVPFLQVGVPAVNLIDFDFPQWHTSADTPEICSSSSLQQVGTLLLDLIRNP